MKDNNWLDKKEYPFPSRFLLLPMGKLHYVDEGQGETILFVHGTPVWSYVYRYLIKNLSQKYRCVALDHIGFGFSDKPAHWVYTPEAHSQNLNRLITHLGLTNITLVLHDFGGPIGLGYALNYPENIKQLVVINSWMWSLSQERPVKQASSFFGSWLGKVLYTRFNFSAKVLLPKAFYQKGLLTPALHQSYLKVLPTADSRMGTWYLAKALIASGTWYEKLWQNREALNNKPLLLVWGTKDSFFPLHFLTKWKTAFPHAKVVEMEAGHFVQEEKPAELLHLIQSFLNPFTKPE